MAVGIQPTKSQVDEMAGRVVGTLNKAFTDVQQFKELYLDTKVDADLEAMGWTAGEVATLRSAFNDLDQLRRVYEGLATQEVAVDFRAFAKRLWGLGFE